MDELFCVLVHGGAKNTGALFEKKKKNFHDVYTINWNGRKRPDIGFSDYKLTKKSRSSESLLLLYEVVSRANEYEYYMLCDDDMIFQNAEKVQSCFDKLLKEYNPLIAHVKNYRMDHKQKLPLEERNVKSTSGVQACCSGDLPVIYHKSVLEKLYPYPFHSGYWVNYLTHWIVYNLYPQKCMRFSGIVAENIGRRKRSENNAFKRKDGPSLWNHFLKKKIVPTFKRLGLWQKKENERLDRLGDKGVSKEKVIMGDISQIVNENHPEWQSRKNLLPKFEKHIEIL